MTEKEIRLDIAGVTYRENVIISMVADKQLFDGVPSVGNCVCGELDVDLLLDDASIPKNAELVPYIRTPGTEWKKKGVYYIYNRSQDEASDAIKIVAYDAIYKAESPYLQEGDQGVWPRTDITVMTEIAQRTGTTICADTRALMVRGYSVPYPGISIINEQGQTTLEPDLDGAMTMREVAGLIASFYAGSWIIDRNGEWRLVCLGDIPPETNYLVTENGEPIVIGEDRILVVDGLVEPHRLCVQDGDILTLGGVRLLV